MLMFYDVRAGKYLESSINSARTVVLRASKGYVVSILGTIQLPMPSYRISIFSFVLSFLKKMSKACSKLNMYRQFTHIATTAVVHAYLLPVVHFLQHLLAIMRAYGNEMLCVEETKTKRDTTKKKNMKKT